MYEERPPAPWLAERVACEWHQVAETDMTQLVVPDGCVDLIWGPDGPFVAGPDTGPMPTSMRAGDTFSGIRFKPGAAGEVFGVPVHWLRDQRVPLADLDAFPELAAEIPEERLRAMRAAITVRLRQTSPSDPAAPAIVAALRSGSPVHEVARRLGYSERQLHRRSVAGFGYSPKTLQRIVRFQRALRLARSGVPLTEVALISGYTDQAHLSHEVRRLSGVSPRRLTA
ncbi:helix-turn-helix domain-containing protein [Nonomuraea cavernae]|uniref:AraC family transcriptional regulator n=1 Tax=Nonomuraea cavernae TaxID=2045107 RepID=A0A917YZD6_9ACTN|nr:helix-turn-helix transcriptional regulator [Nonomuraea cavernae]MCA2190533.1 helix-turn-helix transcriptional regulator [Nonomuraea cavernae]GGO70439.1 AraC family transcriptional regulator [Nonomuraea cavernae]